MRADPVESVCGRRSGPFGLEGLWRLFRDGLEACSLRVLCHLLRGPTGTGEPVSISRSGPTCELGATSSKQLWERRESWCLETAVLAYTDRTQKQ